MDPVQVLKKANANAERFINGIKDDAWELPTITEWNVKELLNHSLSLTHYTKALLEGETITAWDIDFVGDKDPRQVWKDETSQSVEALSKDGALEKIVHLPFGDFPAASLANIMAAENLTHAWDLARATGQDDTIDEELATYFYAFYEPQQQMLRESGNFGKEKVETSEDADTQTKLLALLGRKR